MLWGLILEPFKRYSQTVQRSFHLTNAALDVSTGDNESCQVIVGSDGKDFLICTLQKGKTVQAPLQLFFKKDSEISFTSKGKCTIHLTGFLELDEFDLDGEEEEEDESEEEEVPELMPIGKKDKKRKADFSPDVQNNKKSKNEAKKKNVAQDSDEDSDDDSGDEPNIAKLLEDDETDENDESYIPNDTSGISMADSDDQEDDDEDDDDDDEEDDETEGSDEEEEVAAKKSKDKKKNKESEKPQQNGVEKKNKSNKENEIKTNQQKPDQEVKKEKKVLPGNVAIEDVKVGQGAVAKPGKMVQVYYEGRLKSNNKMFDSCLKGPGFKFKLGKKEVISGWDVGVAGMKVGGKRKIICPPAMAYGKKGSPPVIPPNSTLVFEVELKNVN